MNIAAALHLDLVTCCLQRCRHIEVLKNTDHDCAVAAGVDGAERM